MMLDHFGNIRLQNSVFYFSGPTDGRIDMPKPYSDFYVYGFLQDISRRIVPFRSRSSSEKGLVLQGGDKESERKIAEAVDLHGRGHGSFEWAVSEFLRLATSEMCALDRTTFEIAHTENPKTGEPVAFPFFHIDPRQLKTRRGKLYQVVPEEIARKKGVATRIELPPEQMLIFSLPEPLAKEVRDLRKGLTRLSETRLGTYAYAMGNTVAYYDFKAHEESMNLALAQCSYRIGWDARGSFRDKTLSYYTVDSFLRWQRFQDEVRTVVVATFNEALDRIRLKFPIKGRIVLEGAPTKADISESLDDLAQGRRSFVEIMDRFYA
jgi:hypothetical protein